MTELPTSTVNIQLVESLVQVIQSLSTSEQTLLLNKLLGKTLALESHNADSSFSDITLFKGVRYSEGALHPTVPHTPVPHSNENRYSVGFELEISASFQEPADSTVESEPAEVANDFLEQIEAAAFPDEIEHLPLKTASEADSELVASEGEPAIAPAEETLIIVETEAVTSEEEPAIAIATELSQFEDASVDVAIESVDVAIEAPEEATITATNDSLNLAESESQIEIESPEETAIAASEDASLIIESEDSELEIESPEQTAIAASEDASLIIESAHSELEIESPEQTTIAISEDLSPIIESEQPESVVESLEEPTIAISEDLPSIIESEQPESLVEIAEEPEEVAIPIPAELPVLVEGESVEGESLDAVEEATIVITEELPPVAESEPVDAEVSELEQLELTIVEELMRSATTPTVEPADITGHWAEPFIRAILTRELMGGDGSFLPDEGISRAQSEAIIAAAFDLTPATFSHQPDEEWTRIEAIVWLVRRLGLTGGEPHLLALYQDLEPVLRTAGKESVRSLVADAITTATANRLIVNYPQIDQLQPAERITRAEFAALIYQGLVATGRAEAIESPYIVDSGTFRD
jgi:hypothetical protein